MTLSSCGGNVLTVSCANHFLFARRQNDENRLEHDWKSSSDNNFGSFFWLAVYTVVVCEKVNERYCEVIE